MKFVNYFKLKSEKEDFDIVDENIRKGIDFKGTNLWILVFAILIASLGLNVNSTAVIIGAMLVSPLMGPIMGLGFGMAINDIQMLRRSLISYLFAGGVGLVTSTIYFFISPLNDAHSEILARTAPTIYDVLIALFGGLAGFLATSSKLKGNVIPGVAIATALMPPLCTAGYGLATLNANYFFGAFYLYIINSVFIALATLMTARFLKYPFLRLPQKEDEVRAKRIVWVTVIITVIPSLYFGYDIVQRDRMLDNVERFIEYEAVFPNDYLLQKIIDPKNKEIILTYGGALIEDKQIENLKSRMKGYNLSDVKLEVRQGFTYLPEKSNEKTVQVSLALNAKEAQINELQGKLDSISKQQELSKTVYKELKAQYPAVSSFNLQPGINITDSTQQIAWIGFIDAAKKLKEEDKKRIEEWLKVRVNTNQINLYFNK